MPITTPKSGRTHCIELVVKIVIPKVPASGPAWSVAELGLSDAQSGELVEAFVSLSGLDWEILMHGKREERDQAGLLLVVVLAEFARRYSQGNQIWSCMGKLAMTSSLRDRLFLSNGQPRRELRQIVESAAYCWKLRHVFDIPGHMAWFVTIFLQFGFSLPGATRRLPFWLSGQVQPVAVGYLMDGSMQSQSFFMMWQSLRAYRLNRITEPKCRGALEKSPWINPDWIPAILKQAKSRLDLVDLGDVTDGEDMEPLMLGEPRLIWPAGEEPFFRCEILAAATFELEEACYEIRSRSFEPVRLVRQEEDIYYVVGNSTVDIPLGRASVQCTLVEFTPGAGESELITQSVTLWDPHYPITLYRKSDGSKMADPEHPVRLDEGSFGVFHESFSIDPNAVRAFEHQCWWLVELPSCEWQELALQQDGERVWWPEASPGETQASYSVSIAPQQAEPLKWKSPDKNPEVEFSIYLPPGAELRWIRIGPEVIDFEREGVNRARTTPFTVRPEHAIYPLYATIGFQADGRSHRITQRIHFNAQACILDNEEKLTVYQPHRALNVRNARRFLFHILCPEPDIGNESRRTWVLEGARIIRPVGNRGIQLTDLSGYGASLDLYRGLYNMEEKVDCLACKVRDNGILVRALFTAEGLFLKTSTPIEFDEKHELIAWTIDHQFLRLPVGALEPQESAEDWFLELNPWQDEEGRNPIIKAMGLFYDGRRLGNWFDKTYHFMITRVSNEDEAAICAEMLRWFKAPILDSEVRGAMTFLLRGFAGAVIPIWLESGKSPNLQLGEIQVEDEWLQVVSALCREIGVRALTLLDASQIVEAVSPEFSPTDLENSLPTALEKLDGLSANLIAKITHLYLNEMQQGSLPGNAAATKRAILTRFEVTEDELSDLCEGTDYGNGLGIDPFFVRHLFDRIVHHAGGLTEMESHNRDLLLNHNLMRRLLAHKYLSQL